MMFTGSQRAVSLFWEAWRYLYEKGLLGHSDADVLIHAVMDALLGAAALGRYRTAFSGYRSCL